MKKVENMTVLSNELIARKIYKCVLSGQLVNEITEPGQFVHVKVSGGTEPTLRRPISICEIDRAQESLTMIYRVEGKGTKLLSEKRDGETVDVLGPLGNGFPIEGLKPNAHCLLVGGGIGVPPLYELAKQLVSKGHNVTTVIGFRSTDDVFLEKEFARLGDTYVVTEDGTSGEQGFVTDIIKKYQLSCDRYYACGPRMMLRALESMMPENGYLSLEERMGCGIGACLACVCDTPDNESYRKVCTDGPVFPVGEVVV